ncbi:MAG TPA: peptide deformylase [Longimicrobiaceae bacterium]|nr:peptide deformylase [Longimicrobiaceae bacterium]
MAIRKIELLGADVLRRRAVEIPEAEISDELRRLVRDMFETMYDAEGIGLAGPQIGVPQRVIVVDVREEGSAPFALLNPRIVETSSDVEKADEGCLSIPGISGPVERRLRVVVEGLDEKGEPVRIEAEGLLARCLQHEIDHLDGVLFIDHLSPLKRNMVLKKYRKERAAAEKGGEKGRTAGSRR